MRYVALATLLLGGVSGAVGSFNFLRKKTLVGETVAHSMLPGVLIAFLLSGVKNPLERVKAHCFTSCNKIRYSCFKES